MECADALRLVALVVKVVGFIILGWTARAIRQSCEQVQAEARAARDRYMMEVCRADRLILEEYPERGKDDAGA